MMFRVEFWKCVWDFIVLMAMYLKKDSYYGDKLVEDSLIECIRDMRSLKCYGCHYWKAVGVDDDTK